MFPFLHAECVSLHVSVVAPFATEKIRKQEGIFRKAIRLPARAARPSDYSLIHLLSRRTLPVKLAFSPSTLLETAKTGDISAQLSNFGPYPILFRDNVA